MPALRCPRCGRAAAADDPHVYKGCPACAEAGRAVAYECEFTPDALRPGAGPGLWRWRAALPVDARHGVSLGEGDTPLLRLPAVARDVGVGELYVKNEAANPTGSHKDRLAAVAVAAARQIGAEVVTGASTGNHGAALAAYSASAGLRCVIFTTPSIADPMRASIQVTGAELVAAAHAEARYMLLQDAVDRAGWFVATNATSPPVGTPPIAVEGYKTIAYELWEQLDGQVPDWVVVPVSYGCCLAGIQRGFAELAGAGLIERSPRLAAVETCGALQGALASGGETLGPVPSPETAAFSIAVRYTTDRAWRAVAATGGVAVSVSEEELLDEQLRFGRLSGLYAEVSSSITIAAARRLVTEGTIAADASVVCLLTATGLKDPATTLRRLPALAR
ncbi:MAG TPA: pyridoxal-phosphate dependent enzyme [Solirubrobacteraceae bacterium]|nr:pyridoxal-phosphate dependent enzyme [Solirubrobacteraceae bacterium]